MKAKELKKLIQTESEKIIEIQFLTPSGVSMTCQADEFDNQIHLPKELDTFPSYTAILTFYDGESENGDREEIQKIFHIENPIASHTETEPEKITLSSSEPLEIQQARIFYENLAKINSQSYEKVIALMSQNEKNLDERLEKILKSVNRRQTEEPSDSQDLSPLVGLLQNLISKGGKTE